MRIVIDLQGAQGVNRNRGIGRLSRALARAMIADAGAHDPVILLNDAISESAEQLSEEFSALLPRENIRFWRGLTGTAAVGGAESLARRHASEVIRAQYIAGLDADAVYMSSVVEGGNDDAITNWPASLERIPHVATFYDAIPLMNPDQYLRGTWKWLAGWYLGEVQELRLCDGLLAISESARQEAIDYLHYDPDSVFNIRAGFDSKTFRPIRLEGAARSAFLTRHGLHDDFILFVGAGDARKNELGLVQAYALLPEPMRMRHQLVIVGASDPTSLHDAAASFGLKPQDLVLIRHVSEEDLPVLYSLCGAFVMPSKHEGFGLPALEAMACGASVIASNTTSLPEVVGMEEALFDPHDPMSIADRLQHVLRDDGFRHRLAQHGLMRSAEFTWKESARRAWGALSRLEERAGWATRRPRDAVPRRKPRLAYVTSLSSSLAGLPDDATDLLPELARSYDITLVTDAAPHKDVDLTRSVFPSISESRFASAAHSFDRILYEVRNAGSCRTMLQSLLPEHPGVVILHDASLSKVLLEDYQRTGDRNVLARALFDCHGWPAVYALDKQPLAVLERFPCTLSMFRNALLVVQHSAEARDLATRHLGETATAMVRLAPHCRWARPPLRKAAARGALGLAVDAPIIASFGRVMSAEHALDLVSIWRRALETESSAQLVFVGPMSAELATSLKAYAAKQGFDDRLVLTHHVEYDRYQLWLDAADIALQLQPGVRGEEIDVIIDTISAGLPVMTIAHDAIAALSGEAVVLLADDASQDAIAAALSGLWGDSQRRSAMAAAGHVRAALSPPAAERRYHAVIEEAYARGLPARLQAALPKLPEHDDWDAAHALTQSFELVSPKRLLLDLGRTVAASKSCRTLTEWLVCILAAPQDGWVADIVCLDEGMLKHSRRNAAVLLGLPDHGLLDELVSGRSADSLVLLESADYATKEGMAELRRLRRRGVHLIVLVQELPSEREHEPLTIADGILCLSEAIAQKIASWLDRKEKKRVSLVHIGWLSSASANATSAQWAFAHEGASAMLPATLPAEAILNLVQAGNKCEKAPSIDAIL